MLVITKYIKETFDFVFSSHCLEHMNNPYSALKEWWKLVKVGGYLYVIIPDEDLYEQGVFPSRYNPDHKWTFTINKAASWSLRSVNVIELVSSLPNGHLIKLETQDRGYDYALANQDQTLGEAMAQICFVVKKEPMYVARDYTLSPHLFYCWVQSLYNVIVYPIRSFVMFLYGGVRKLIRG